MKVDRCRHCYHVKGIHLDDADGSQCNSGWLLNFDGTLANPECHCDGYEPLDNLEYLEMKCNE
jgi:hypothetical protein